MESDRKEYGYETSWSRSGGSPRARALQEPYLNSRFCLKRKGARILSRYFEIFRDFGLCGAFCPSQLKTKMGKEPEMQDENIERKTKSLVVKDEPKTKMRNVEMQG